MQNELIEEKNQKKQPTKYHKVSSRDPQIGFQLKP